MAAKDPDKGIFMWVEMSDFNTPEETGKALPLNLRPYVTSQFLHFLQKEESFPTLDEICR